MAMWVIIACTFILPSISTNENNCSCNCVFDKDSYRLQLLCSQLTRDSSLCCPSEDDERDAKFNPSAVLHLSTVGSNFSSFNFEFISNFTNLRTLNLSSSGLKEIIWDSQFNLSSIEEIDLSQNELTELHETGKNIFVTNRNLKIIGLDDNPWNCRILHWFIDWVREAQKRGLQVLNKENLKCFYVTHSLPALVTQNETDTKFISIWEIIKTCPPNCSCTFIRNDIMMQVNCNGRGLTDFPLTLPEFTRLIHLENNQIKNFANFLQGPVYKSVSKVFLDNNLISSSSLGELDGIRRYHRLSVLYLSGNKLTELPLHVVENLESLKLGGNPWNCDCSSGTALRNFLIDQSNQVNDLNNVTCAPNDPKHPNKLIIHLSQMDLCLEEENGFHYLDLVNALLATLTVVVLVKLVYDWWHFRKTGQVPVGPNTLLQLCSRSGRTRLSTEEH